MDTAVTGPNGEQVIPTPPGVNGTPESAYATIASKSNTDDNTGDTKPIIIVGDEDDGDYR